MNDPLGLFEQANNDPLELFKEEPSILDKVSSGTKRAFASVGNAADVWSSSIAASIPFALGQDKFGLEIMNEMEDRRKTRNQWGAETDPGTVGKIAGGLLTLPMQMVGSGLSPADTAYIAKQTGSSNESASNAALIDAAGNMVGTVLPGISKAGPIVKGLYGAGTNAAQEVLTKKAIQATMDTEAGKKAFQPTIEDTLVAAAVGGIASTGSLSIPRKRKPVPLVEQSSILSERDLRRVVRRENKKVNTSDVLYADKEGIASKEPISKVVSDAATVELAKKQQAEVLAKEAQETAYPQGEQIPLFGEEMLPHETNPAGQLTRQPEQISLDLSFDSPVNKQEAPSTNLKESAPLGSISEILKKRFEKFSVEVEPIELPNGSSSVMVRLVTPDGKLAGFVDFSKRSDGVLVAENVQVANDLRGKGAAKRLYIAAREAGFDIAPGKVQTDLGNKMVSSMQKHGIINKEAVEPRFSAGDLELSPLEGESLPGSKYVKEPTYSVDLEFLPKEERPTTPDTPQTPKTPETLAIKQQEQKKLGILAKSTDTKNFPKEWLDVTTLEEAKHLAATEPDLRGDVVSRVGRQAASGIHGVTIMSGNPLLRYIRKVAGDGRATMARLSQQLVTNKQDGLAIKVQALNAKELTSVIEALRQGSQNKFKLTPEVLDQLGFNDKQKSFVEAYYKHSQALLDAQNASRADLGFKPIDAHEGWFTDVWKGQYKTAVMNKEGDIIAFITTDTNLGQRKAREYYSKKYPDATFGSMLYSGLNGKNTVDVFSGLNDVLAIIAKNDPKMAEILAKGQEVQKLANNDLFGVSKHELRKSGKVGGSEGNKPWLSREQNAKEAARAMIDYFETAIEHLSLQKPLAEINKIVLDPEINQPNAKAYLQKYGDHISGKTGDVGKALNSVFDIVGKLGVGSRVPVTALSHVKNLMNRKFMGLNLGFLSAQLLQPAQTWAPVASVFASKLGLPQHDIVTAFARGSQWALVENLAKWYENPSLGIAPIHIKEAIQYANDRGLFAFNELELSHRATKKAITRKAGEVADFTISAGDRMTKLPAFLGLVDILHIGGGIPLKDSLAIAEKGLESGMTNYHPWERPQMYQRLGVLGQFAGGLTTFKHSQANLYMKTIQEAFGKAKDPRSMLLMTGSMVFFAGITGLMGYAEADQLYGKMMELTTGKPRTIREDFLKGMPEFLKSGVISTASGLNWQAKVSAADMVPDTLTKAASPHLEAAGKVVGSVVQAVNDPSNVNIKNAVQELMPTGLSKLSERLMNTDEQGQILGKDGLPKYETPDDPVEAAKVEQARKTGSWLGMGTIYDAIQGTDLYKDRQADKVQQEKQKALAIKIKGAVTDDEYAKALKLAEEYDEISGVPGSGVKILQDLLKKNTVEKQLSPRQRAQGTPKNLAGVRKWENYNDGE